MPDRSLDMPGNAALEDNFSTTLSVDQTADEVFAAINDVRRWWSEDIEGSTDSLGEEFSYHNMPVHRCTIRVTELVPGERVVWHVMDNFFAFTEDKTEWKGTEIRFDISRRGDKTELIFTHLGLVPDYECFDVCSNAWGFYVNTSLRGLIRTGKGLPNQLERDSSV
jgi:Activator of Hsp90 ATPase homolog 1-like protein